MTLRFKHLIFLIIPFLFAFFFCEIGLRLYQKTVHDIPFLKSRQKLEDPLLGWTGKKIFGDPKSSKFKIFIIGDSYTDGVGAKENQLYYRVLEKKLNAEMFIYGGLGFGTLQEYLVLDRYIDEIQPDLIVLQVTPNDFINNSYLLEKKSYKNNNMRMRPYWINTEIQYFFPRALGKHRFALTQHSRFLFTLFNKFDIVFAHLAEKGIVEDVDKKIKFQGLELSDFRKSVDITQILIKKIKNRSSSVAFVATSVKIEEPYHSQFVKIFKNHKIPFFSNPALALKEITDTGVDIRLNSRVGHWNEQAHQIFGEALFQEIKAYKEQKSLIP